MPLSGAKMVSVPDGERDFTCTPTSLAVVSSHRVPFQGVSPDPASHPLLLYRQTERFSSLMPARSSGA